mmetsp:Transcript_11311/g.16907  ORF Transcript_11311/g.16907 Transcript_11311/m.16907 type:complete len:144 (-) Transcript_11311:171-602(-)
MAPLAEGGISEKKKVKRPNIMANGPGETFDTAPVKSKISCIEVDNTIRIRTATKYFELLNLLSNSRKIYMRDMPKNIPAGFEKTKWHVKRRHNCNFPNVFETSKQNRSGPPRNPEKIDAPAVNKQRLLEIGALAKPDAIFGRT